MDKLVDNISKSKGKLKRLAWKIVKSGLATGLGLATLNSVGIIGTYFINKGVSLEANTIVLSSASESGKDTLPVSIGTAISDFFMYVPITLRQNISGNRVDWYSNPSRLESLLVLGREEYKNVILIGHGRETEYMTKTGGIYAEDLRAHNVVDKPGFLLQHTCGGGDGERLRDVMLKNPEKGYFFEGSVVDETVNYFYAVKELVCPSNLNSE